MMQLSKKGQAESMQRHKRFTVDLYYQAFLLFCSDLGFPLHKS